MDDPGNPLSFFLHVFKFHVMPSLYGARIHILEDDINRCQVS